ncbi:MAG: two-component system response regulator [Anaerolinea sp.]|nr:two-component system response regulator [Anaerolinea sp.]
MTSDPQKLSVLLVEDNAMEADLTLRAFTRINFINPVEILRDGAAVLELLEQWKTGASLPGLILLDINLPKVTGLEVLRKIKSTTQTSNIPIVVLTSSTNENDIKFAYEYGANSYIIKPVDYDKFVELVSTLCYYWTALNVRPELSR